MHADAYSMSANGVHGGKGEVEGGEGGEGGVPQERLVALALALTLTLTLTLILTLARALTPTLALTLTLTLALTLARSGWCPRASPLRAAASTCAPLLLGTS